MRQLLARLDDRVALFERIVVLVFLSVMTAAVFFDVVHRVSATPDGMLLKLLTALWPGEPTEATVTMLGRRGVPAVSALITWFVCYGALRTASGSTLTRGKAALVALGLTALLSGFIYALLAIFPHGLVWSQPLALGLLLWVALFGATLATKARGHIVLEVAARLWPPKAQRFTRLGSGLVTSAFCFCLVALGAYYTLDFYEQWEMGVGYLSGLKVPRWTVYAAMPFAFTIMGLRFAAYAIGDFLQPATAKEVE